ncbi:unnamed protein product [Dicrocoelium dendriticum]|nr:unnamed protein product [Dicrocoelium dendriticum]
MCADAGFRKSGSPQSSTESSSLSLNRLKNKEALEKGLRCRRSIKELVNQGILLSPSISNADKVRQLQRAKTSDILKQKIERRPDRQYLVNRRIIRDEKPGTSPFILQQCHNLEKYQLKSSLNSKLIARPGTLELVEKGVLQVDPGIDSLIRHGSIEYPRVECIEQCTTISTSLDIPAPPPVTAHSSTSLSESPSALDGACGKAVGRAIATGTRPSSSHPVNSRSIKEETVVYKVGSLVFHNYCPKSSVSANTRSDPLTLSQHKQRVREAQQAEMLRLQDTARAHRLVEQELSCRIGGGTAKLLDPPTVLTSDSGNSPEWQCVDSITTSPSVKTVSSLNSSSSWSLSEPLESIQCFQVSSFETSTISPVIRTCPSIAPSVTKVDTSFSSYLFSPSLDRLSVTKLRSECRERNLSRSGPKAALIRQLEPYRDEILAKHFGDRLSNLGQHHVMNSDSLTIHNGSSLPCAQNGLLSCTTQHVPVLPLPPPVWTFGSLSTSADTYAFPAISTTAVSATPTNYFLSSSNTFPVTPTLSVPSTNPVPYPYFLLTPISNSVVKFQLPLHHHSQSAFYITNVGSHLSAIQGNLILDSHLTSTSFVPIHVATGGIPEYSVSQALVHQLSNGTSSSSSTNGSSPPSAICSSQGFVSLQQNVNVALAPNPHGHICNSTDQFSIHYDPGGSQPMCVSPSNLRDSSTPMQLSSPTGRTVHQEVLSIGSSTANSSGLPPSLSQIEDVWLRIRQLRQRIAKLNLTSTMNEVKSEEVDLVAQPDNVRGPPSPSRFNQLVEEHDRLAVLCRLLVIERIDALDEQMGTTGNSGNSDSAFGSEDSASRLQVERNLMDSYLCKLGGTDLLNRVSSPSARCRRSSSPLPHSTVPLPLATLVEVPGLCPALMSTAASSTWSSCITSTPRFEPTVSRASGFSTSEPAASAEEQPASRPIDRFPKVHSHSLDRLGQCNGEVGYNTVPEDACAPCDPTEPPPPSPMTTDALFELWSSVLKDTSTDPNPVTCPTLQDRCYEFPKNKSTRPPSGQSDDAAIRVTATVDCNVSPVQDAYTTSTVPSDDTKPPVSPLSNKTSDQPPSVSTSCVPNPMDTDPELPHFLPPSNSPVPPSSGTTTTCPPLRDSLDPSHATQSTDPVSLMASQLDWSSFVQSYAQNLYPQPPGASQTQIFTNNTTVRRSYVVSPTEMADALFTSFDTSEFSNLMDTSDPSCGLSTLAMNWSMDT